MRNEPGKIPPVKSPQTRVVIVRRASQWVQVCAFENAGVIISEDAAPKTHSSSSVTKDRIDGIQTVPLAVSNKAVAFDPHRPRVVRAQPKVAAHIFVERGNVIKTQAVPFAVCMKPPPLVVAVREELKQAKCARNPEFAVRSFKELEHPGGRHSLPS